MHSLSDLSKLDVLILCGGFGKRLGDITKLIPKGMIEINDKPFLSILMEYIAGFGFKRFVLCTGYKAQIIKDFYKNGLNGLNISFSEESKALGTGGAVKNARSKIKSMNFLTLNGDSLCKADLNAFYNFHKKHNADVSILLSQSEKTDKDVGFVKLNSKKKILSFNEKQTDENASFYVNAGIYFFNKSVFDYMNEEKFSLEYDFFPAMCGRKIFGFPIQKEFLDIGTPKRLTKIRKKLKNE